MFGFIVALILFISFVVSVWALARHEILWCYVRANTIVFVVGGDGSSEDPTLVGYGGVVDILHEVPGKRLDKSNSDKFEWTFVDGEEDRGLLHFILRVQWIGPGRSLRVNQIRDMHLQEEPGKNPSASPRNYQSKFVYFSREQAVEVFGAKTMGPYRLDFPFNLMYKVLQPMKAVLGVSNPNTVLSSMVRGVVNNTSGAHEPEYFLQGDAEHKREMVEAVKSINPEILEAIGISLTNVNLLNVDLDEESRRLFALLETKKRENAAAIAVAEKDKTVAILANDAEADRVSRVLAPIGEIQDGALIKLADSVKDTKLHTLVLGAPALPVVETLK